jgi:hypothetical protein
VKHLGLHNHSAALERAAVRLVIVHQQEIAQLAAGRCAVDVFLNVKE